MRRGRKIPEIENHDRWVVSYADFITLLFAFFTTLYAISQVDQGKLVKFTGSMKSAFKASGADAVDSVVIDGIKPATSADLGLEKELRERFNSFALAESIVTTRDERGVRVSIGDAALFDSGSAELRSEAAPLLRTVASLVRKSRRPVLIEGHTDNLPLRGQKFTSNIELSTARASSIFSFLAGEEALQPERISAAGYGEYRPVASNATPEGRARNRRVDIVFVTERNEHK